MRIIRHTRETPSPANEKDEWLNVRRSRVDLDIAHLSAKRMLHYMKPAEVREVAHGGVDIQLHTHRHRTPRDRDLFVREIEDNVREIQEMTGPPIEGRLIFVTHAVITNRRLRVDRELGIQSATTCQPGLVTSRSTGLNCRDYSICRHSRISNLKAG